MSYLKLNLVTLLFFLNIEAYYGELNLENFEIPLEAPF